MRKKSIKELISDKNFRINLRYDLTSSDFMEIQESATGFFDAVALAFNYGYLQGGKAEKARIKKKLNKS